MHAVVADKPGVGRGCVWTLDKFEQYLRRTFNGDGDARVARMWDQIGAVSKEVVTGIAGQKSMKRYPNVTGRHFQHLGLDLVMDNHDAVWLCEVNDTPGLDSWESWATTESSEPNSQSSYLSSSALQSCDAQA